MFAFLGDIEFQVVGSPEALHSVRRYDYAEQRVIEDLPRLQWLANDLERLSFEMVFHSSFTSPAAQLAALRDAADAHQALPLVFGNGDFRGYFVIESLATRATQLSAAGDLIAITARLELKEWALDQALDATIPIPLSAPIGVVAAPVGAAAASTPEPGIASLPPPAAGVSAVLKTPLPAGLVGPSLQSADIPAAVIVRSALL